VKIYLRKNKVMANSETIKTTIDANINTNGNQSITGAVLNRVLNDMVDEYDSKLARLDQEFQAIKDAEFNIIVNPHVEKIDMGVAMYATIEPDKFYVFGEVASLAIGLAPQTDARWAAQYLFQFTCPADVATSLSMPLGVVWSKQPLIVQGKTYQVSVLDNKGIITEW
jgi:hypothetical protein